jgi:hypothetical protein
VTLVRVPPQTRRATELAPLLDGSKAGELIPELMRHGLQQLIELEVAAVLGADRHDAVRSAFAIAMATGPGSSPPRWAAYHQG